MNKYLETFIISVAAITVYKLLITVVNYYRYRPDEVEKAPNDFADAHDQSDLNGIYGGY